MIVVKKKMKKPLIIVILAAVLAVLTVAAILLDNLLLVDTTGESSQKEPPVVDTSIGESIYLNSAVAYPRTDESHITSIFIAGKNRYALARKTKDGPLVLSYQDKDGTIYDYDPPIAGEDSEFEYEDIYATEQNDQFGTIRKITYLTTAFGALYFDEKMALATDEKERKKELSAFGFGEEDSPIVVHLTYSVHTSSKGTEHDDEKEVTYAIKVGNKLATNQGYYYMVGAMDEDGNVDYRPYIYSTYSTYIDYAFIEFTDYIKPILIAEGLPMDNAFEPYLTTDYQQYKNTLYEYNEKTGERPVIPSYDEIKKLDGINVIVNANVITPNKEKVGSDSSLVYGGVSVAENKTLTFDLKKYSGFGEQERLAILFAGKNVNKYSPFSISIPSYTNTVDVETGTKYKYVIKSIDAILTSGEDNTTPGAVATDKDKVKVTYSLTIGTQSASQKDMVGVIDLSDNGPAPSGLKEALIGKSVGSFGANTVDFECVYTTANSVKSSVKIVIEKINSITKKVDDVPEEIEKVEAGATVNVSFYYVVDGNRLDGTPKMEVIIGDSTNSSKALDEALMGKTVGSGYSIEVDAYNMYSEVVASFTEYEIDEIKYFVVKEKIVSFKFQQASERNPYYGESFYMNTMEGDYKLYALNAYACEGVVKVLGGLVTNATSSTGLVGAKTVDVVITPEKMHDYNLYDYSIYFELPRGITVKNYMSENTSMEDYLTGLDDYEYAGTLGFNLYISREDPATGTRYIASDLYDVIAEIDGENFKFLDQTFVGFYARRNLVLTNITNIGSIKLEFMMDDVKGTYSNKLQHNWVYAYDGGLYDKSKLTDEQLAASVKYDAIDVIVTPSGDYTQTELSKYIKDKGYTFVSLRELYGPKKTIGMDSAGTANFKEFIQTLYFTHYEGYVDEQTQKDALENGELLMRMSVTLEEGTAGASAYDYVYEFYRVSSRRVVVRLYRQNRIDGTQAPNEDVSDFYISIFSFKKLVNKYFGILNADNIDNEIAYPDDSILN